VNITTLSHSALRKKRRSIDALQNASDSPPVSRPRFGVLRRFHSHSQQPDVTGLHNLHRTFRQRLHERAAVRFGHDAIIENNDDPAVGLVPD
jgi:hypothetical protein